MCFADRKIIYVDMDDTLCDYRSSFELSKQQFPTIEFPQSTLGFFSELAPLPYAIETFHWLSNQIEFVVFILSAPSVFNAHSYIEKRLWVEKHLGFEAVSRLIISPNKGLNKGHYLIDDAAQGRGQEFFDGEFVHFGVAPFKNWLDIKEYFNELVMKIRAK